MIACLLKQLWVYDDNIRSRSEGSDDSFPDQLQDIS